MPDNFAAWIVGLKVAPLEVRPTPYTKPGPHEIVVKNAAVAINPADWGIQTSGSFPIDYPNILGHDLAGEVAEVGTEVTRFKVGDRVFGAAIGLSTKRIPDNAFQLYPILYEDIACHIPSHMSYETACVLPVGLNTAAFGFYQKGYLELPYPSLTPILRNEVILIWGGASSVGTNGIQLARASGYEVITTCSPKNFDYVKKLGVIEAFDYSSSTVVDDIVAFFQDRRLAGVLDCITRNGAAESCINILTLLPANHHKFISSVLPIPQEKLPADVKSNWIFANLHDTDMAKPIYEEFLFKALDKGKYLPLPEPEVVGNGLEAIQGAFESQKKASAKKIVVSLTKL